MMQIKNKIYKWIREVILFSLLVAVMTAVLSSRMGFSESPAEGFSLWVEGSTIKIEADDVRRVRNDKEAVLKACRNEYEPFQLVVSATNGELRNVRVEVGELVAENGDRIGQENIKLFREWYINCGVPSDEWGKRGRWPDALIPFVNPYIPSQAVGVPFDVPSGQNQPVWIRIYVPKEAVSGIYSSSISVSADNEKTRTISLTLHVWDFALPDETHLKAIYGVENGSLLNDYFGLEYNSAQHNELRDRYYDLLAENRLAPGMVYYQIPYYSEVDGNVQLDFSESDRLYSRLLDEKRVSAFGLPLPWDDINEHYLFRNHPKVADFSDGEFINKVKQYFSILYNHFEEKGWIGKHYLYLVDETGWVSDEPYNNGKEGYERVVKWSELVHDANPNLKFVIMDFPIPLSPYWPDLRGYGDIWDPYMDDVDIYPEAIRERQSLGEEIWVATNMYADYIDYEATIHRSVAWFAYKYDLDGLDQWDTTFWWSESNDKELNPWQDDPMTYAGNGGGAMIYPGKHIGVDGPISTIRLELSRESLEDYEYLYLLEQLGGKEYGKAITARILPSEIRSSEVGPEIFYAAKEAIAEEILSLKEQKSGLATIEGKVTNTEGDPLVGVFVSTDISGDTTDDAGRYRFSLPAGEKKITAAILSKKSSLYPSYYQSYGESFKTVTINAGDAMSGVDFSLARIQKSSAVVSSFEGDVGYWMVENSISDEQSSEHVTDGAYSYRVVFDDEQETDIYIELLIEKGSLFDALEFDVHNEEEEFTDIVLYIGQSWEYEKLLHLPPASSVHVSIPMAEIEAKIKLENRVILGFSGDNIVYDDEGRGIPLGKKTLYFDNIRLIGEGVVVVDS